MTFFGAHDRFDNEPAEMACKPANREPGVISVQRFVGVVLPVTAVENVLESD
jgi:hypothetical protein